MDISKFIQSAVAGDALQAREAINDILSSRAFEAIDGRKKELSQTIFGGKPEEVEVQDTADTEIEEDEHLTQEEFESLSEEDQELYLEALEQLDEDKKLEAIAKKQLAHIPGKLYKAADGAYYKNHKGKSHISNPAVGSKTSAPRSYSSSNDDDDAVAFQKRDRAGIKLSHDDFIGSGYGGGGGALSYDRKRNRVREEVELNELEKSTLASYVKKRVKQVPDLELSYQMAPSDSDARMVKKYQKKVNKGIGRAVDRLAK